MSKQTTVEWIESKLNSVKPTDFCSIEDVKDWVKQAKEMEKEQNARQYKKGWDEGTDALYKEVRKIYDANKIFYNIDS